MNYHNPLLVREVANGFVVTEWERPEIATSDDKTHVFNSLAELSKFMAEHFPEKSEVVK